MTVRSAPHAHAGSVGGTQVPDSLIDLLTLSSSLAIRWATLTDESRFALIRQIQRLTAGLGLETGIHTVTAEAEGAEQPSPTGSPALTPRELDVLRSLAAGHSTGRVAVLLGISPETVRSHVKSLLRKLGVHSRLEAVSVLLGDDPTRRTTEVGLPA